MVSASDAQKYTALSHEAQCRTEGSEVSVRASHTRGQGFSMTALQFRMVRGRVTCLPIATVSAFPCVRQDLALHVEGPTRALVSSPLRGQAHLRERIHG